jgi:hypothetical protein
MHAQILNLFQWRTTTRREVLPLLVMLFSQKHLLVYLSPLALTYNLVMPLALISNRLLMS